MKIKIALLCGLLLAGCASTTAAPQHGELAGAAAEECSDAGGDRCTVFLCGVEACALYSCEDVDLGGIVRAQAAMPIRPPARPPQRPAVARPVPTPVSPQRYWGSMQGLPENAEPIFIIPWNEASEAYAARLKKEAEDPPKRTWVKHHVFPRAFKGWFNQRGINIHEWTLVLDKQVHQNIHRGVSGGPWNKEWERYIKQDPGAQRQAIHLFAVQLIFRFDLSGPVVPYYSKKSLPLFPVIEEDIY